MYRGRPPLIFIIGLTRHLFKYEFSQDVPNARRNVNAP